MNLDVIDNDDEIIKRKKEICDILSQKYGDVTEIQPLCHSMIQKTKQETFIIYMIFHSVESDETILVFDSLCDVSQKPTNAVSILDYWQNQQRIVDIYLTSYSVTRAYAAYKDDMFAYFHDDRSITGSNRRGRYPLAFPNEFKEYLRDLRWKSEISLKSMRDQLGISAGTISAVIGNNDYTRGDPMTPDQVRKAKSLMTLNDVRYRNLANIYSDFGT